MSTWIIPANVKAFDLCAAYAELPALYWKQTGQLTNIAVGDDVYIHAGAPLSRIVVKTRVAARDVTPGAVKADKSLDDRRFSPLSRTEYDRQLMDTPSFLKLALVHRCPGMERQLSLEVLRRHGVKKNIQGAFKLDNNLQLLEYIQAVDQV